MDARLKTLFFALHKVGARMGVIVLPNHYYADFPDVNLLAASDGWTGRSAMRGIDVDINRQARTMSEMCAPFMAEYRANPHFVMATKGRFGPGFGYIEAQALHGVLRSLKPKRIVEVGSGVSTYCMSQALKLNANRCELICVEPHPSDWLKSAPVTLITRPVQSVCCDLFTSLREGDFLFIDSSHAVKTGSDVNYLILEVLPLLRPGVTVHFHDITLPYDYQPDALRSFLQPQETALLRAFLTGNRGFKILFCMSQLHHDKPDALKRTFPDYCPLPMSKGLRTIVGSVGHFPSSLYLQTV